MSVERYKTQGQFCELNYARFLTSKENYKLKYVEMYIIMSQPLMRFCNELNSTH